MTTGNAPALAFDQPVAPGGYVWWYLDALSDDGQHGLTLIAFVGSVFSPYYALARRRGQGLADPANHCAMNLALYATPGSRQATGWAMTERNAPALQRDARHLRIGPSQLDWDGHTLTAQLDEIAVPLPRRLRGVVRLQPTALHRQAYPLDADGRHLWQPIAPSARVTVEFEQPRLRWQGHGYLDTNRGSRPLETDFVRWDWSRAALAGQRSAVLYDVVRRDASPLSLALAFDASGGVTPFEPPPLAALPATGWRLARTSRSDEPSHATVTQTLEDGPFYARSVLRTQVLGESALAVHESLDLKCWAKPAVQLMLPFRMPRRVF